MKEELAKKLKDAGFPIPECPAWIINGDGPMGAVIWKDKYIPTLSELIEACGKRFFKLQFHERDGWSAQSNIFTGFDTLEKGGYSTPEEAVANLWLALNSRGENKS
jgi:hypothetical protein